MSCTTCHGHACMACYRREFHLQCVADCGQGCDWLRADDTE